jgi:hypothetical protein
VYFTDAPSWSTGSPDTGQSFAESLTTTPDELPDFSEQQFEVDSVFDVEHSEDDSVLDVEHPVEEVLFEQHSFSCAFKAVTANMSAAAKSIVTKILIFIFVFLFGFKLFVS